MPHNTPSTSKLEALVVGPAVEVGAYVGVIESAAVLFVSDPVPRSKKPGIKPSQKMAFLLGAMDTDAPCS